MRVPLMQGLPIMTTGSAAMRACGMWVQLSLVTADDNREVRCDKPCSPPWTTPTASATARRFTGSRACPREGGGPALAKAGDGMLPSDFFRRNVVLSFQEDAIGIRLPRLPSPACGGGSGWGRRQHDVGL